MDSESSWGVFDLLNFVPVHTLLDWCFHSITMEVFVPTRYKTAKIHRIEHAPDNCTAKNSMCVVPECSWVRVFAPFTLHWLSVGQAGIWSVHKPNGSDYGQIYYVEDSRNGNRPETFTWQQVNVMWLGHLQSRNWLTCTNFHPLKN